MSLALAEAAAAVGAVVAVGAVIAVGAAVADGGWRWLDLRHRLDPGDEAPWTPSALPRTA